MTAHQSLRRCAFALPLLLLLLILVGCGGQSAAPTRSPTGAEFDRLGQEEYGHIVDNPYQSAAETPISTFSTDVNTASYSNVRRMLGSGTLPPKDAVLLAEMINYFPYAYPAPAGDDPVAFGLDIAPCPWNPKHHLARIGLKAKSIDPEKMPARNLVFLVDVSGSMESPTRLPLVKKSLNLLIRFGAAVVEFGLLLRDSPY